MTTETTVPPATRRTTVRFSSGDADCEAWHYPAVDDRLRGPGGRPSVLMAHGLAGTRDSGLEPFATELAAAGLDVLLFDYRGFGGSGGEPRQSVSLARQAEDYRSAIRHAGTLAGVDPRRLVLWGVSLSGGTVLTVAAGRDDVAAVVSLTPLVDGLAAGVHAARSHPPRQMLRSGVLGIRSKAASALGRPGRRMPVVGRPGEPAALNLEGCYESYLAIAGPTWRNEVDAAVTTELGSRAAIRAAARVEAPVLVQIADLDRSAPPHAAARAACKARAHVRHYPCDHFDVFPGFGWHDQAVRHQVGFLTKVLAHLPPTS